MWCNLRTKKIPEATHVFNPKVMLLQPVEVADGNTRVVRKSEFQPFDIAASLSPFTSSDFSITSLQSIGALGKLSTTYMSSMHDMNVADQFDSFSITVADVQEP